MNQQNNNRIVSADPNIVYQAAAQSVIYSANAHQYAAAYQHQHFAGHPGQYAVYPVSAHPSQTSVLALCWQGNANYQHNHPQYNFAQQNEITSPHGSQMHCVPSPQNCSPPPPVFTPHPPVVSNQIFHLQYPFYPPQFYQNANHYYSSPSFAAPSDAPQFEDTMVRPEHHGRSSSRRSSYRRNFRRGSRTESRQWASQTTGTGPNFHPEAQRVVVADSSGACSSSDLTDNNSFSSNLGYPGDPYVDNYGIIQPGPQRAVVTDTSGDFSASNLIDNNSYSTNLGYSGNPFVDNHGAIHSSFNNNNNENKNNENSHSIKYVTGTPAITFDREQFQMPQEQNYQSLLTIDTSEAIDLIDKEPSYEMSYSSSLFDDANIEAEESSVRDDLNVANNENKSQPNQDGTLMLFVRKDDDEKTRRRSHYENWYWKMYKCNTPPNFYTDYDVMPQFTRQIWQFFLSRQLTERNYVSKINALNELEDIFKQHPKGYVLSLMGSTLSGLAEARSGIDINVTIPSLTEAHLSPQDLREEIRKNAITIVNFLRMQNMIHSVSVTEYFQMNIRFTLLSKIPETVHFTMNKISALQSTHMNVLYTQCDWRLQPVYFFVKYWAVSECLTGRPESYLSSYAINLLVIYFLQRGVEPAVLPVLHELESVKFTHNISEQIGIPMCFKWRSSNSMQLGQLVRAFFLFYDTFDFKHTVISIKTSKHVARIGVTNDNKNDWMFIEDPITSRNVASSCYSKMMFNLIISSMQRMSDNINEQKPLRDLLKIN